MLTSIPAQITSQVTILPPDYLEVAEIACLAHSLSFMHLEGFSLSQSTEFLLLPSFFSGNGRREVAFKSQIIFAVQVHLRNSAKPYILCTKICKLS